MSALSRLWGDGERKEERHERRMQATEAVDQPGRTFAVKSRTREIETVGTDLTGARRSTREGEADLVVELSSEQEDVRLGDVDLCKRGRIRLGPEMELMVERGSNQP
jgi:hypothetical protein